MGIIQGRSDPLRICAVVGKLIWSSAHVMRNVKKHSRNIIELRQSGPPPSEVDNHDIIYYRFGNMGIRHKVKDVFKKAGVKLICGISGFNSLKQSTHERTEWKSPMHIFDAFTANSLELTDIIKTISPEMPVFRCQSGVDTEMFAQAPLPDDFYIGWAGNVKNSAKKFKDFKLLQYEKRVAAILSEEEFPRYLYEDMPKFYGGISLYVSTALLEGGPLPPKEAASCGRPVVALKAGDLPEWMPEEYLVDTVDELIPLIEMFKNDKSFLEREGERFRQIALTMDYKYKVKAFDDMFEEVASW